MFSEWSVLAPAILTAATGVVVLTLDLWPPADRSRRAPLALAAAAGLIATGLVLWADVDRYAQEPYPPRVILQGAAVRDGLGLMAGVLVWAATAFTVLLSGGTLRREGVPAGEFYGLLFLGASGMMFLAVSHDLMMVFLSLETMSFAVYALTALPRNAARPAEAAMKYFVVGGFASSLLLFGMAMVYGATGRLGLSEIGSHIEYANLARVGLALLLVGAGFKIGAAPFHMWVPDAYQGAPAVVAGFMSSAVKAAAFVVLLRIGVTAFPGLAADWGGLLWVLCALTLVVGNLAALVQTNLKRLLAYSSIAHTGYALLGLVGAGADREAAGCVVFYVVVYTAMTLGSFGVLALAGDGDADLETLEGCAGLARRRPLSAAALTVFLVSLAGIPPTAGFMAKFYVFRAAIDRGFYALAALGILGALVSVYYYLRPVVAMYMQEPAGPAGGDRADDWFPGLAVGVSLAVVIGLGIFPSGTLTMVTDVMRGLILGG